MDATEKAGDETAPSTSKPRKLRLALVNVAVLLGSLLFVGLATELGLRLFYREQLRVFRDERNLLYDYHKTLGWFPRPNSTNLFMASRRIRVAHNSEGFRAPERVSNGRPNLVFIGDSFVWGYDVEADERFTDKLQERLPAWNVFNLGVSGYGTDQEFLLLQMHWEDYKPKIVFLIYNPETDEDDNSTNVRYFGYYKPYCRVAGNNLEVLGIPVPRGERAFLAEHPGLARSYLARLLMRAWFKATTPPKTINPSPTGPIIRTMQKYLAEKGTRLAVGLTRSSPGIEDFLRHYDIPFVDLSTNLRYPDYGNHWTPEGHTLVANKIEAFLQAQHWSSGL